MGGSGLGGGPRSTGKAAEKAAKAVGKMGLGGRDFTNHGAD